MTNLSGEIREHRNLKKKQKKQQKKTANTFCSLQCWRKPAAECSVSRFSVFSAALQHSLLNVPLFHCCQKMSTLLQLNLSAEPKLSDATHVPINHTTPNKKRGQREHRRDIISFVHVLFWPCWHGARMPASSQCKQTGCLACVTQRHIAMKWGPVGGNCQLQDLISAMMMWGLID